MTLCEAFNIKVHATGAECSRLNGIVERYNLVLSEMLNKVLEENCILDIALAWCLKAKNTLKRTKNVHGFSPFQLAVG